MTAPSPCSLWRVGVGTCCTSSRIRSTCTASARLVDEARAIEDPQLRYARLATALDLWRGPALADAPTGAVRERLCGRPGRVAVRGAVGPDRRGTRRGPALHLGR
ncbi:BTAD domain-containing putative transcriptional regulator [Actinoplanes sp. NPDC004185]